MTDRDANLPAPPGGPSVPPLPPEDHVCAACGFDYRSVDVESALATIRGIPGGAREALAGSSPEALRRRPAAGGWSATEYLCHLRDVHVAYTIRLHRARTEEEPTLEPMFNDLRALRFGYNALDAAGVLAELGGAAGGLLAEAAETGTGDWARTARRLPGESRTALWLLRQAAHEGVHHLADIRTLLGPPG